MNGEAILLRPASHHQLTGGSPASVIAREPNHTPQTDLRGVRHGSPGCSWVRQPHKKGVTRTRRRMAEWGGSPAQR